MLNLCRLLLITLFTLIITGCGYHLRGHEPMPTQLKILYLQTSSPYSEFTKQLKSFLASAKVALVDNSQEAPITLEILNEGSSQQLTSAGASGQTNTYTLTYSVAYQLLDNRGQVIQSPQNVSTTRNYSVTSNQILGDTNVQTSLITQMQRDVIYQILNRLRTPQTIRNLSTKLSSSNPVSETP